MTNLLFILYCSLLALPAPPDFPIGKWKLTQIVIQADTNRLEVPVATATPIMVDFAADGTYSYTENGATLKAKWQKKKQLLRITHIDKTQSEFEILHEKSDEFAFYAAKINLKKIKSTEKTMIDFAQLMFLTEGRDWQTMAQKTTSLQIIFIMKPHL